MPSSASTRPARPRSTRSPVSEEVTPSASSVFLRPLPGVADQSQTHFLPELDKSSESYLEFRARLDVAMGGRAAEEILLGKDKYVLLSPREAELTDEKRDVRRDL